jgi:hypothetical protein
MSTVDPSPKDPTGYPGPPVPRPVPAVDHIKIPVPAGDTDILRPAVVEEEIARGEQENEEAHG